MAEESKDTVQLKDEMIESNSTESNADGGKKLAPSLEVESVPPTGNLVLQKLLRAPRYFDSPIRITSTLSSYEEYPISAKRRKTRKKQICHYCGAGHFTRNCKQIKRLLTFSSDGKLTIKPHEENDQCLKCGENGHDMFSCSNEYDSNDLKEARCYVCKEVGHLCCGDSRTEEEITVSCYSCGQSGHSGPECPELKELSLPCSNGEARDQSLQRLSNNPRAISARIVTARDRERPRGC